MRGSAEFSLFSVYFKMEERSTIYSAPRGANLSEWLQWNRPTVVTVRGSFLSAIMMFRTRMAERVRTAVTQTRTQPKPDPAPAPAPAPAGAAARLGMVSP